MKAPWPLLLSALVILPGCLGGIELIGTASAVTMFELEPVTRSEPKPFSYPNCPDLREALNERALTHARVLLDQRVSQANFYGVTHRSAVPGGATATAAMTAGAAGADRASAEGGPGGSARGAEVTGTNNQEAAADEADLVKTDGEWTYVLAVDALHILHSTNVGDVEPYGRIEIPSSWGGELLLERRVASDPRDDRLLVILPTYGMEAMPGAADSIYAPHMGMTRVLVYSLADRAAPRLEHEAWLEGHRAGARLIDGTAYVIVHRGESDLGLEEWIQVTEEDLRERNLTYDGFARLGAENRTAVLRELAFEADGRNQARLDEASLDDHLPAILVRRGPSLVREPSTNDSCKRVLVTPESTGRSVTTLFALSLDGANVTTATAQVLGGQPIVYASENSLVLASPSQDAWWYWAQPDLKEATDLQWFELDGLRIEHVASGRVAGSVLDSFAIDVEENRLRVATTTGTWGRWWLERPEPMMSHVAVFEAARGKLLPRGVVGGIAPGERIWSARFTEDRAYLVTFRQTDPLWVIDLSGAPRILGELEIPGVSTYIHPLDDDALLTIGLGPAGESGDGLDWGKLQVSLFDISDPSRPKRADVLTLAPQGGSAWSSALDEHKAFTYWDALGVLAVPLTTYRTYPVDRGGWTDYAYDYHVGLRLVDVDRKAMDLSMRGEVDQDDLVPPEQQWGGEIQRSYFLGYPETGPVSVYAVSLLGVTAHDLETLEPQGRVVFQTGKAR